MYRYSLLQGSLLLLAAAAGCQPNVAVRKAATEIQAVPVSHPVQRNVTDHVDFTGRADSEYSVDVRSA